MKTTDTSKWLSYYLYYTTDPDKLLASRIWPFVQQLKKEGLFRHFFFIRYEDERGPHIRLRLLSDEVPSHRIKRQVVAHFPDAKFAAYIPETERYGGPVGLPIAEQLFEASSTAILQLTAADKAWNYGRALASAMQLHIGMLQAFSVSQAEAAALFLHIAQSGKRTHNRPMDKLEQAFKAQHDTVAPSLNALWSACEKDNIFSDIWFAKWREAMKTVGVSMHRAHKAGKLTLPESFQHVSSLWFLYESYIHMTNNRLGVAPRDEPFAAYILHRSLGNS
jgi:thiopeptide-type bacteriocin biosynthesis protein